jgi:hypothetical protein
VVNGWWWVGRGARGAGSGGVGSGVEGSGERGLEERGAGSGVGGSGERGAGLGGAGSGERGWEERGGAACALEAYLLEDLHAVHTVHHHVAEHQVELLARRHDDVLAQQLQAVLAAARPLSPRTDG